MMTLCSCGCLSLGPVLKPNALTAAGAFDEIEAAVARLMASRGHGEDDQAAVRLALDEALENAAQHGSMLPLDQPVDLVWEVCPDLCFAAHISRGSEEPGIDVFWRVNDHQTLVEVYDDGDGFDPNRPCRAGRGVALMRQHLTWMRYLDGGRGVLLCRLRQVPIETTEMAVAN
jgi:hypothetical protein